MDWMLNYQPLGPLLCALLLALRFESTKLRERDEIDFLLINRITYGEAKVSCSGQAECQ